MTSVYFSVIIGLYSYQTETATHATEGPVQCESKKFPPP